MWAGRSCNCFRTTHGWPTHGGSLRSIGRRSPWPRRRNKTATQSDTKPIETIVVDSHYLSLTWLWFDLLILLWHVGVLRLLNLLSTTCWSLIQHIQLNPIQIVQFTCDMCVTCALQLRKKWSKFWIVRKLAGFPIETNPKNSRVYLFGWHYAAMTDHASDSRTLEIIKYECHQLVSLPLRSWDVAGKDEDYGTSVALAFQSEHCWGCGRSRSEELA